MKVLTALFTCLSVVAANAADLDKYEPTYATPMDAVEQSSDDWNGFYAGIHGGYLWGTWDGPYSYDDAHKYPSIDFDGHAREIKADEWLLGVTLGADRQLGSVVAGVVIDAAWANFEASDTFTPYPDQGIDVTWDLNTEIEAFGTARARLGVLLSPDVLAYGTGGLAWARVHSTLSPVYDAGTDAAFINGQSESSNNHIGWALGGGLEWKLSKSVSLSTEYLYADLGEQDYSFAGENAKGVPYNTDNFHPDLILHSVKIGANYRF